MLFTYLTTGGVWRSLIFLFLTIFLEVPYTKVLKLNFVEIRSKLTQIHLVNKSWEGKLNKIKVKESCKNSLNACLMFILLILCVQEFYTQYSYSKSLYKVGQDFLDIHFFGRWSTLYQSEWVGEGIKDKQVHIE